MYELNRLFGFLSKLVNDPTINLNGQSGSKQVPFWVLNKVSSGRPDQWPLSANSAAGYRWEKGHIVLVLQHRVQTHPVDASNGGR